VIESLTNLFINKRHKLPVILQDEIADCGYACVAMISHYFGHRIDLYTIKKVGNLSNQGVTLLELYQLLDNLGFRNRAIRVSFSELKLVKMPAIIHWDMNHFVVLKNVTRHHIIIHDPAIGMRRITHLDASNSFTGIVLEVQPSHNFKKMTQNKPLTLYDLAKTTYGINSVIIVLILLSLSIEVLNLLNPLFMQYVTDNIIGSGNSNNLYPIASAFCILTFVQVFVEYIRGNMVTYITMSLTEQFSANIVRHILKLPLDFFEKRNKGDIQSKFQTIDQIQKKISTDFINTVLDGFMITINVIVMMIYSPLLTLVVVTTLLLYLILRYTSYHSLKKQTESSIIQHAKASSTFLESLQAIIPIKIFLKESVRFNNWQNYYLNSLNADIKIARINVLYTVADQFLFRIEHIIVVCLGSTLVLTNHFSLGMLISFLSYRLLLVSKAYSFIQHLFDYQLISVQLSRLSDILFQQPEIITLGRGTMKPIYGALTLKNVCFKYHFHSDYIINNINIEITAGEKIAIIGPSGCGKSTLLKVMMGLLTHTSGNIYLDNVSITDFGLKNYRELTASVMQDDILLAGSLIDNICFFDETIDIDWVYHVTQLAHIHDTIVKLPMGYETIIGELGSTLSGGQKQRLLLARALYKRPKILFLDEATSHLDVENEKNINNALKSLSITQIIIAHRQETINMADRVIDFDALAKSCHI
jgi:ATP-binding cassette subfamily B protein RaxB